MDRKINESLYIIKKVCRHPAKSQELIMRCKICIQQINNLIPYWTFHWKLCDVKKKIECSGVQLTFYIINPIITYMALFARCCLFCSQIWNICKDIYGIYHIYWHIRGFHRTCCRCFQHFRILLRCARIKREEKRFSFALLVSFSHITWYRIYKQ